MFRHFKGIYTFAHELECGDILIYPCTQNVNISLLFFPALKREDKCMDYK